MGKLALGLIIFVSITLLPALSQAQNFRGGGIRSGAAKGGFGARGSTAGYSGSSLKGGINRSAVSSYRGAGLRSNGIRGSFVKQPGLGQGQNSFRSGFSNTNKTGFGGSSNLTRSTLSTQPMQSQNFIHSRRNLGKSINGVSSGFSPRSFNKNNLNQNEMSRGEKGSITSRSNVSSTFGADKITNDFIHSKRPVFTSGSNLNSTVTPMRTTNFTNGSSRNTQITVEEIGTAPGLVSDSSTRTRITHWVDKKSGVRHFSNSVSSYRNGRETITFVGGKKVVSKIGGLNSGENSANSGGNLKNALTFTRTAVNPIIKQKSNTISSNSKLKFSRSEPTKKYHHKSHHKDFDHHHHRHHHDTINFFFFTNPFFSFPTSTFFFGFNPFVFKALVLSPFTFRPFFPSAFFTFTPTVSSPFLFNNFLFPNLFFPSFFDPFALGSPFFFNQFQFIL